MSIHTYYFTLNKTFLLLLLALVLLHKSTATDATFSPSSGIVQLTPGNFDTLVKNSREPWIVQFYSPVCGYCKQFAPEYEKAARKMKNSGVRFGAVDAIEYDDLGERYRIRGYPTVKVFGVDKNRPEEYTGKRTAQALMETAMQLTEGRVKRSGVWGRSGKRVVGRSEQEAENIGPQRTAYEILCELSTSINIPVHELVLEEWILNETMTRPIHYTEKVLNIVLKWGYWEENDRKDNCLIVTRLNKYMEYMEGALTSPLAELRYADSRSKQMKPYMFEFSQAKLRYYKDRYSLSELGSWNIEDIVWYLGHEGKRANHIASKYTVTFIVVTGDNNPTTNSNLTTTTTTSNSSNSNLTTTSNSSSSSSSSSSVTTTVVQGVRSKSAPYFGHTLAWRNPADRALWCRMFLHARHLHDLTPPPQHVNLMTN